VSGGCARHSCGWRRASATDDTALVGGLSLALGSNGRATSQIRAAAAELALSASEREALQLQLYATLAEADGRYRSAQLEVARLREDVLPTLARAEQAAERAWRGGAISYLEWAQLQSQRIDTLIRQLEAAATAQAALIEIQRLTGQAFVATASRAAEDLRQ
jgi:cobalt-zinc-cadmium efflux system outer membrane protein